MSQPQDPNTREPSDTDGRDGLVAASAPDAPPPAPEPAPIKPDRFLVPSTRRHWLIGLLIADAVVNCASLALSIWSLDMVSRARAGNSISETEALLHDGLELLAALGIFCIGIATIVVFCCWFYRTVANARVLAPGEAESPGFAVGSFFIPILCLYRPYLAARGAWRIIAREAYLEPDVPPRGRIVGIWWTAWIISNFVNQVLFRMALSQSTGTSNTPPTLDEIATHAWTQIGSDSIGLVLDVLCGLLVHRFTAMQQRIHDLVTTGESPRG